MRILLSCCVILSLFPSCKKDDIGKQKYRHWKVESVSGAAAVNVNETISLAVFWPYSNGCDMVDKFEETRKGLIIYIKAMGYNSGGVCTMDAGIKATSYKFFAATAGVYELRFLNPDGSYILHTVLVQ